METVEVIIKKNHVIMDGKKMTKEEYYDMLKRTADAVIDMAKKRNSDPSQRKRG